MSKFVKIVIYVPQSHAGNVREAAGKAGAGVLGNYSFCTFSTKGIGRFKPLEGARPTIGEIGEVEEVPEERIETWCGREKLDVVIEAIKKVHPYEEVPIDIYPLEDLPG